MPENTILVVDDDADVVKALTSHLFKKGFGAMGFTDPSKALGYFVANNEHICLVLADVRMPSMPGIEFLKRIMAINPKVRTLLMTGFEIDRDYPNIKKEMLELQVSGCIRKPFSLQQLSIIVESYYYYSSQSPS